MLIFLELGQEKSVNEWYIERYYRTKDQTRGHNIFTKKLYFQAINIVKKNKW